MVIERNISNFDRKMRTLAALIIALLYITSTIYYWWGELILTWGVFLHVTGLMGFSPLNFIRKKNYRH